MTIIIKIEIPEVVDVDGTEADNVIAIVGDSLHVLDYNWYIDEVLQ